MLARPHLIQPSSSFVMEPKMPGFLLAFALVLVAGLPMGATRSSAAEPAAAPASVRALVVDANGQIVGRLSGRNKVLINFPDGAAVFSVEANGFAAFPQEYPQATFPGTFLYESDDCTGQAYAVVRETPPLGLFRETRTRGGVVTGAFIYVTGKPVTKTPRSEQNLPSPECWSSTTTTATVTPIRRSDAKSFRLPFSVVTKAN